MRSNLKKQDEMLELFNIRVHSKTRSVLDQGDFGYLNHFKPLGVIFFDIRNAKDQPINAFISIIVVILVIFSIFSTRLEWISGNLFLQSCAKYSSIYSFLHILRNIWVVWLFWISSSGNKIGLYIAYWWIQLSINLYLIFLIMSGVTKQHLLMIVYEIWIIWFINQTDIKFSL